MYDSIASWMMAGGPRDEPALEERRRAPHSSSERTRRRSALGMPRWIRADRVRSIDASPAACCAAA